MKIVSFTELPGYQLINKLDNNHRDIRLYDFSDINIQGISDRYPNVLLRSQSDDFLILPIKEESMSLRKKSFYEEHGMTYDCESISPLHTVNEPVYFFIYNTENYYHFIYDTLPYLYCYLKLRDQQPNLKLLMNYNENRDQLLPFVKESLQLLGIGQNEILIHQSNMQYSRVYLSSSLTHNGMPNSPPREEIFDIYQQMVRSALKHPATQTNPSKIYISRRTWISGVNPNIGTNYTTRRKLTNEDELVCMVIRYGFQETFGENLTMVEKIHQFNRATHIIGSIGGTITNCVFCNPKCRIICLVSPTFLDVNYRMKFLLPPNTILFQDTSLDAKPETVPKHVRVEITAPHNPEYGKLGEIDSVDGDKYQINLAENYIGWNSETKYSKITLHRKDFRTLDNGINSPWKVDLERLEDHLVNLLIN